MVHEKREGLVAVNRTLFLRQNEGMVHPRLPHGLLTSTAASQALTIARRHPAGAARGCLAMRASQHATGLRW